MTNLEIALIALSIAETAITFKLYRKMKKALDNERQRCEDKRVEYEKLIEALPIGRNLL